MSNSTQRCEPGMRFRCEACGQDSITKETVVMDGWRPLGRSLCCALCGAPLEEAPDTDPAPAPDGGLERLASLLGTAPEDGVASAEETLGLSESASFCRRCRHFYRHPFEDRCLLHRRAADPMGHCEAFESRDSAAPSPSGGTDR